MSLPHAFKKLLGLEFNDPVVAVIEKSEFNLSSQPTKVIKKSD